MFNAGRGARSLSSKNSSARQTAHATPRNREMLGGRVGRHRGTEAESFRASGFAGRWPRDLWPRVSKGHLELGELPPGQAARKRKTTGQGQSPYGEMLERAVACEIGSLSFEAAVPSGNPNERSTCLLTCT